MTEFSQSDETRSMRIRRRLRTIGQARLGEDVPNMTLHRVHANYELVGDLDVALAFGNKTQDLRLSLGNAVWIALPVHMLSRAWTTRAVDELHRFRHLKASPHPRI